MNQVLKEFGHYTRVYALQALCFIAPVAGYAAINESFPPAVSRPAPQRPESAELQLRIDEIMFINKFLGYAKRDPTVEGIKSAIRKMRDKTGMSYDAIEMRLAKDSEQESSVRAIHDNPQWLIGGLESSQTRLLQRVGKLEESLGSNSQN